MGNYLSGDTFNFEDTKLMVDWGQGKRELAVSCNDTIRVIKQRIRSLAGFSAGRVVLWHRGQELEDTCVLGSYNIPSNATIIVRHEIKMGKPVIRLRSLDGQPISNVNVHVYLNNAWNFSSIYPQPTNSDGVLFIEWNNIEVHSNGQLIIKQKKHETDTIHHYPLIDNERDYRMLFWEAMTKEISPFSLDHGLCVPRSDFARVLNYLLKKMTFSSEDRDDMITYILPHLDEADPEQNRKNIIFRFLSPEEYKNMAQLQIQPIPDQIIRAYLLYGFGEDGKQTANMDELENEVKKVIPIDCSHHSSGLSVHEWGSMFVH